MYNLFPKSEDFTTISYQDQNIPRVHQDVGKFECKFCERHFQSKNDLMKHNKNDHFRI